MAIKTLYLMGGTLVNSFQPMQDGGTAPTDAFFSLATGWISAANANANMSELRPAVVRARTTFAATVVPTAVGTGATANAFRTPTAYSGNFAAGNWTLSASMRSSVAQPSTTRLRWRVFASTDATGATGVRELTTAVQLTNAVADVTTANSTRTVTWAAPAITLNNEYLFFACALEMVALSGTGTTRDNQFRQNSASAITTTDFTATTIVAPTGFADTEDFGTESIQLGASPTGFAETEAFGNSPAELDVAPTGFADTEAFGTLDASQGGTNVTPTGFADTEAFGTPVTQLGAGPTGTADTEAFGTPTAQIIVAPTGFADTEAFGTPGAQLGAGPTGFAEIESFGSESVAPSVSTTGFADSEAFGTEVIQLGAGPTGFADTEAFGTDVAQPNVQPTSFADTEAFGSESIRVSAQPLGFADTEAFGTPSAGPPPSGPAPTGFADTEAFGTPVIQLGASPIGFADAEAFGNVIMQLGIAPAGFADTEAFGTLLAQLGIAPAGFADTEAFGTPDIGSGAIVVYPAGFADAEAFGLMVIVGGQVYGVANKHLINASSRRGAVEKTDTREQIIEVSR